MTLEDLKAAGIGAFLFSLIALPSGITADEAVILVPLIATTGSLGFSVWLAATVADATVKSLKKEN